MELGGGFRGVHHQKKIKHMNGDGLGLNSHTLLVMKLTDLKLLRVVSRSLFFTLAILALPSIGFIVSSGLLSSDSDLNAYGGAGNDSIGFELLRLVVEDVADEGLIKIGDNALIVSSGFGDLIGDLQSLKGNPIDMVLDSDLKRQSLISEESYDFTFASNLKTVKFVDRVTRIGGIVAMRLSNKTSNPLQERPNYKIVYLRRFNSSTVVAVRKTGASRELASTPIRQKICAFSEAKKRAMKGLEGALLEPPRRALANSNKHLKETKFLPELLGHSLEGYHRLLFINVFFVDGKDGGMEWFHENYPKGDLEFELYNLKMVTEESTGRAAPPPIWISDWLQKNVRGQDEFVVMKAEAEVVVELMKEWTICLVDELFLECDNQWQQSGKKQMSKRAYWECLALFGKLRDEGVAVHQWWG